MKEGVILLVEDNVDDVALTQRAFQKNNIRNELVVARDGAEAVDLLFGSEPGLSPVLILLDLKLPKVDGLQVLRRIRAEPRTQYVPVVILTSSQEDQDVIKGYQLGCNSYVRKPVSFEQFAEAVRELGLYWLLLNVSAPRQSHGKAAPSANG